MMLFLLKTNSPGLSLPDVWVLQDHGFWSVGENPDGFRLWTKEFMQKQNADNKTFLNGFSIKFLSAAVYELRDGKWTCLKCRLREAPAPFCSSLEEARLKSTIMKWPDPRFLAPEREFVMPSRQD